jgi:hypothetical protein
MPALALVLELALACASATHAAVIPMNIKIPRDTDI